MALSHNVCSRSDLEFLPLPLAEQTPGQWNLAMVRIADTRPARARASARARYRSTPVRHKVNIFIYESRTSM